MDLKRYISDWDKLTSQISIPVDKKFSDMVKRAKGNKFEFNDWAREILKSRIHELIPFCCEKETDRPAE